MPKRGQNGRCKSEKNVLLKIAGRGGEKLEKYASIPARREDGKKKGKLGRRKI